MKTTYLTGKEDAVAISRAREINVSEVAVPGIMNSFKFDKLPAVCVQVAERLYYLAVSCLTTQKDVQEFKDNLAAQSR